MRAINSNTATLSEVPFKNMLQKRFLKNYDGEFPFIIVP